MRLKFIGADGSMGLKHGKVYSVNICSSSAYIWVEWRGIFGDKRACPYSSPATFAANWEGLRRFKDGK